MDRREFIKWLGILLFTPFAAFKAVWGGKPPVNVRGSIYDVHIRPTTAIIDDSEWATSHTTMRGVLASEEFKNRRMSKMREYMQSREFEWLTGEQWTPAQIKDMTS